MKFFIYNISAESEKEEYEIDEVHKHIEQFY